MRKLLGLVVILAVLVLGGYYGMGAATQRTLTRDINLINQVYKSQGLFIEIQQYKRRWFTSTAQLKWTMHIPARTITTNGALTTIAAQDFTVDMPLAIYHGPIIIANSKVLFGLGYAETELNLPQQYVTQFDAIFSPASTKPKLELSILVNYLNRSHLRTNIPPFKLLEKAGSGQFEWLGMKGDVTLSPKLTRAKGNIEIKGLNITKDNLKAVIGKINSDYHFKQTKEGIYIGHMSFSLPSIMVNNNNQPVFQLENFDVRLKSDITHDGLFNSYLDTSVDKIFAEGKTYGPGKLKLAVKNLDAKTLSQINQQLNQLNQGTEQDRQKIIFAFIPELPRLFSQGATLELSQLSFTMPQGTLKANLLISLPKEDIVNPFDIMKKTTGNGHLALPGVLLKVLLKDSIKRQLVQKAAQEKMLANQPAATQNNPQPTSGPQQSQNVAPQLSAQELDNFEQQAQAQSDQKIATLVQAGLLVQNGSDYVIECKLNNGQLTINGRPFNPGAVSF